MDVFRGQEPKNVAEEALDVLHVLVEFEKDFPKGHQKRHRILPDQGC